MMTTVEFELSDEEFLIVAKLAQREGVTFDEMLNKILDEYLEKNK